MDSYAELDVAIDSFEDIEAANRDFSDRQTYRLGGIINNVQTKYTRKGSRQFAVFNLATRNQTYELIMFPDAYAKNGARIEEGKLALIHGTTNRRDGELSLTAYDIFDLENSIPRIIQKINFILHPKASAPEFLQTLRDVIDAEYNNCRDGDHINEHSSEIAVSFLIDNQIIEINSSSALKIAINGSNYKVLRQHPTVAGIRVEAFPMQAIDDRKAWEKLKSR